MNEAQEFNLIMRLVQLAAAIRQNNDRLACQEFDATDNA